MIRFFVSANLAFMFLVSVKERLSDPSGFAGPSTGYVTVAFMVVATIILLCLIWSRDSFLTRADHD